MEVPETSLVNMLGSNAGIDLLRELQGHYQNDLLFQSIMERPKDYRNFEVKNELIYLKEARKSLLCIPKIIVNEQSV